MVVEEDHKCGMGVKVTEDEAKATCRLKVVQGEGRSCDGKKDYNPSSRILIIKHVT